ncbi:NADPH:adrenodoxin oxidoreductase, mitochondrial [Dictyocoela muelleri]|nr:NADPH:adrenodoxin oxidoreductase, mitochondrial [Dictyocoela muelleri]
MKVCIVGAGPAGVYLGKFLAQRNCLVHIFEKESEPFGLKRTSFSPEIKRNRELKPNENLKIFYNSEKNIENLKSTNYDFYVLATGGVERKLNIPGGNLAIPSSEIVKNYKPLKGDICIIGMGNVAMDIIRNLKGYNSITAITKRYIFNSTFSNSELAKVAKLGIKIYFSMIDKIFSYFRKFLPRKYRRRYELIDNDVPTNIKLHFNTIPLSIEKNNDKLKLKTNRFEKDFDHIISAIGYEKPDLSQYNGFKKPLLSVGWAKLGRGNLSDVYFDSINTGNYILKYLNSKK